MVTELPSQLKLFIFPA